MEVLGSTEKINDPGLPLSSLRLLVPPLQLLSAAMWQLAKQKDVMNYEKLQEFVFMVTEAVPGLINHRQRAQLILGLRARLILELCKGSARGCVDTQVIQSYLDKLPITSANIDYRDAEVKTTESTFIALVQSLLKDPIERAYFFQEVFPVEYGQQYDAALNVLLWELLSKMEKLLPVPDLKQTAAWLSSAPSVLEECVQSSHEELSLIFEHYKSSGLLKMPYGPSSTIGSCIMSALSIPPSQKTNISVGLESIHNYANVLNPVTFVGADQYSVVAVYTEVEVGGSEVDEEIIESAEVQVHTDFYEEEIVAVSADNAGGEESASLRAEEPSETVDVAKALETLTKTFALRKESLGQDVLTGKSNDSSLNDECATGNAADEGKTNELYETSDQTDDKVATTEEVTDEAGGTESNYNSSGTELKDDHESLSGHEEIMADVSSEPPVSETQQSACSANTRRSSRLQMKTSPNWQEMHKFKRSSKDTTEEPKMSKADVSVAPSVIAVKGIDKGGSNEMTTIIFTCSQCPFHSSDENSPPHFHMQSVRTEVYRTPSEAKFTPSPSSTDEIFTSIKLFPKGNAEQSKADLPDDQSKVNISQSRGKQKALTCETCGKTFTRTSDVRRHQLTHTGERPFHCSQCDRTFQHSWDLAKHESKHRGVAISFPCQLCKCSFANLRALTFHHKKSHSQECGPPQICSICTQSFATSSELLEHKKSHVTSKRYICQKCGEGFDSLLARSQHRQIHRVKPQFKCPQCEKTFTRRSDVKRHLSTHTGERPYHCNQCNKQFSLHFMLMKHLRVHTGERPFQCSHCPKRFTLVPVLARHERMHTGEKPFLCSQCGKGFLSQGELSKHHTSHVDDRPYSCPQCGKCFKSKKTQQEHIITHMGARPYPCTYCGKGFTKPHALTRHNLIHTGERPFPCTHCEKSFLTLTEAQQHQRIHTGERPYACNVCELKFRSSSELARHKRSHSGQKPQKPYCEQCMKTFTSKAKLQKHMETHREEGEAAQSVDSIQPKESNI
ncbi:zinc finger protein 16-like [Seriola lalandi dorsalis]|uniref:Zinc finger protein 865 n=1 Tax=Seriola lalandi dorsalis TaxID=1841481 RepID=A0A3B4YHK9_SERLL|nr:zinc finger protein 16-like [Seriola lalandi dorsalis]XP_056223471.1 zinc finger protein 16-like isoform X1 [Seriola aureovittata]